MKRFAQADLLSAAEGYSPVDLRNDVAAEVLPGAKYQEALLLWIRWNDAHERITSTLFRCGQDAGAIEQALDQLDQLRLEAVRLSQQLLDKAFFTPLQLNTA